MAGLKELRTRIETIKSTQKITSAMKMVAAARLRKSQGLITKSESYIRNILASANLALSELHEEEKVKGVRYLYPQMMTGTGNNNKYLLLVLSSDRGLCGSYNANVAKEAAKRIEELKAEGKEVSVLCIGKKGGDILKRKYADLVVGVKVGIAAKGADYDETSAIASEILDAYRQGKIDVCEVVVSHFRSAINRDVKVKPILPVKIEEYAPDQEHALQSRVDGAAYDYEPHRLEFLDGLLPLIFRGALYQAVIHAQASEQGARMTSMNNATGNAEDMIGKLTVKYNRIRQTAITTELIEIISGAEAL